MKQPKKDKIKKKEFDEDEYAPEFTHCLTRGKSNRSMKTRARPVRSHQQHHHRKHHK